jgi:TPR repeat protein
MKKPAQMLLGALIATLVVASAAVGGPYEDAEDAWWHHLDGATAIRILRPLAARGNVKAQHLLGQVYTLLGRDMPGNPAEALKWFRKAAEQGDVDSQINVGITYFAGYNVPQNYAEAAKWFRRAADQGDSGAQAQLGNLYFYGFGVPRDYVQAHMWFNLATTSWAGFAMDRDKVAAKMTPAQIAEAQKLASDWRPRPER